MYHYASALFGYNPSLWQRETRLRILLYFLQTGDMTVCPKWVHQKITMTYKQMSMKFLFVAHMKKNHWILSSDFKNYHRHFSHTRHEQSEQCCLPFKKWFQMYGWICCYTFSIFCFCHTVHPHSLALNTRNATNIRKQVELVQKHKSVFVVD